MLARRFLDLLEGRLLLQNHCHASSLHVETGEAAVDAQTATVLAVG